VFVLFFPHSQLIFSHLPPPQETQINYQNVALGVTLAAFCGGVYWYSTRQVHKSPEADEINALNTELLREESSGKR
jgi:hypothetical protein